MEPAAYVAEYHGTDGLLTPYGYDVTELGARLAAAHQVSGASQRMKTFMMRRTVTRPLDADEASEVSEYFATPW
jgi:hypothetical protein